jgi:hypothetical protein
MWPGSLVRSLKLGSTDAEPNLISTHVIRSPGVVQPRHEVSEWIVEGMSDGVPTLEGPSSLTVKETEHVGCVKAGFTGHVREAQGLRGPETPGFSRHGWEVRRGDRHSIHGVHGAS